MTARPDLLVAAFLLYGLAAGYLLVRLRRGRRRGERVSGPLAMLGWLVLGLSLALAVSLMLYAAFQLTN